MPHHRRNPPYVFPRTQTETLPTTFPDISRTGFVTECFKDREDGQGYWVQVELHKISKKKRISIREPSVVHEKVSSDDLACMKSRLRKVVFVRKRERERVFTTRTEKKILRSIEHAALNRIWQGTVASIEQIDLKIRRKPLCSLLQCWDCE